MIELSGLNEQLRLGHGGDTFNMAIYLRRVLSKTQIGYASRLGCDYFSELLLAKMEEEGIATEHVLQVDGALPAIYAITLAAGERDFHYWRKESPVRKMLAISEPGLEAYLRESVLVIASGITLAVLTEEGRQRLLETAGDKLAYVINHRPALWSEKEAKSWHLKALAQSGYVFASDQEQEALWPQIDRSELSARCRGELIVSTGASGGEVWKQGERIATATATSVIAVDTTAAGDSLAARYLAGKFCGESTQVAIEMACMLASEVVCHHGAIIPRDLIPQQCLLQ